MVGLRFRLLKVDDYMLHVRIKMRLGAYASSRQDTDYTGGGAVVRVEAQPRSLPDPTGASRLFRPREREKLGPHDGLGPGYGADEARDAISRRFKNALVRHALPRLVRDSRLCDRVALTREHIFSSS
jgi:hypothetical protein